MTVRSALVVLALLLAGCSESSGPPLVVRDVVISAPGAGMSMAAGYLEIENRSGAPIRITTVASPEYESVEMHETTVEDGIARMRAIRTLEIGDKETITFERGGKHLMLMRPVGDAETVTLNFYNDELLLVSVSDEFTPAAP